MFEDVERKLRKGNAVLFSRGSECLREFLALMEEQKHRALVMWALDCANAPLARFEEKYPDEPRPRTALELCEAWARGKVKMPAAKRAILDAHAVAKEIDDKECGALCHAVGHAGATVHVGTHAPGLAFYELTALVLRYGEKEYRKPVQEKIGFYRERLDFWRENVDKLDVEWAGFLNFT
jgi:hypothetical protein